MRREPVVVFLVGISLVFGCVPSAFGREKCKPIVHYDKTTGKLTFKGFGIGELSAGTENKQVQVASDLTQIFDQYRVETCELLNRGEQSPQYQENLQNSLEATARLATLMAVITKGKLSDDDTRKVIELVPKGKEVQAKVSSESTKAIPLTGDLEAANPEFTRVLNIIHSPPRGGCAWDILPEQNKDAIDKVLVTAPALLAQPLNILPAKLRTYIFLPCSDGRLHVARSLVGPWPPSLAETIQIQKNYGFVGVAYATGHRQVGQIPGRGETVPLVMGTDEVAQRSQEIARRLLLEPDQMYKTTARWVIAVPLKNQTGDVLGVISLSSDEDEPDSRLEKVGNGSDLSTLSEKLASLLVTGSSAASAGAKN